MPSLPPTKVFEPCRGRWQIERRAWCLLERCRQQLELDALPLPIPVEAWIEAPLGFRFGFADLSHIGEEVLGAAYTKDKEILIDERAVNHQGRLRFTCAHELGHLTLHAKVRSSFHDAGDVDLYANPDRIERQADRFAAAFLMPVPLLERELIQLFDENRLKPARATMEMMQPTLESEWLWRKLVLPRITRRFDVSLSAALRRFNDIRPKVSDAGPLLPWGLIDVLLRPPSDREGLRSIWINNGVAVRHGLFTKG